MSCPALDEPGFHACCQLLLQQSEQLGDGWSWLELGGGPGEEGSEVGYLKKTVLRSVAVDSNPVQTQEASGSETEQTSILQPEAQDTGEPASLNADDLNDYIKDEDAVCTAVDINSQVLQYEYHILYSCSYSTPVLYFRAFTMEGRSLTLQEVWSSIHPNYRLCLQNSPLTTITQQEHPLLGQPFFMLHPCKTEEFMRPLLQASHDQPRPVNYVLSWLSVVGPVVGLDIPLKYCTLLHPASSLSSAEPD
ncbi:ubiquitin-like-conjugating enzyme ATG10 isoform X2 [Parambassis ranga]|nr:ubiquitin-like-conjugating enzyme ATG10 isoform X2 [Parambassis ranga]